MTLQEIFRSSSTALVLNKVRTFLTMLGVVIGVFAVVSLVSLVKGFENYITDQFSALGSNLIWVMPGVINFEQGGGEPSYANNKLGYKHIDLLKRYVGDEFTDISPMVEVPKIVKYKTKTYTSTLMGGTERVLEILSVQIDKGRFYTKSEVDTKAKVVILGKLVVEELFPTKDPIGEQVKIDGINFTVIGTAKERGPSFDDRTFIPETTVKSSLAIDRFTAIIVKVKNGLDMEAVASSIKLALRRDLKADDFTVMSQKDILSSINSILNVLSICLAAIAGISLFVGGIGIMNIMLVSVTERTREIGLRKALGATSRDIMLQFMTESVVISILGGSLGLLLAWLSTLAIQSLLRAEVPWWSVLLAFGFSLLVGVIFGTYPALSASKKDPIEALRYE
jgi:ABC-type antimicrobial peptide transport system permease subunit